MCCRKRGEKLKLAVKLVIFVRYSRNGHPKVFFKLAIKKISEKILEKHL